MTISIVKALQEVKIEGYFLLLSISTVSVQCYSYNTVDTVSKI